MRLLRRTGTEPVTALSPYGLRRVLATLALGCGVLAGLAFGVAAWRPGGTATGEWVAAAICLGVAAVALVDLLVLRHRPRS